MSLDDFAGLGARTNIDWRGDVGVVEYGGGTKGQVAIFYLRPTHNPQKSLEAGRQVFEDKVYVRIAPPGERLNVVDRPATAQDARLWPMQWSQFQQNKAQTPEGTPIEQFHPENPSVAAMMRGHGVHTIEQLAGLSADAIDTIGMGSQRYVNEAAKYLEVANKGVTAAKLTRELEERDGEIRVLKQQIDGLKVEIARLSAGAAAGGVSPEQLQAALASLMGKPPAAVVAAFDAQTAAINANSPSSELAKARRTKAKKG